MARSRGTLLALVSILLLSAFLGLASAHPQPSPGDGSSEHGLPAPTQTVQTTGGGGGSSSPDTMLLRPRDSDSPSNDDNNGRDPPPYRPIVTPPPDQADRLASMGYRQETFYTCNTIGGREHCGWHNPIVAAADAAPGRRTRAAGSGAVVAAVGCLAGVFALGMM
ncbi:acyl-CoA dehydrogenase family protein [Purpureocillium lavendulum]|uniref:Acyl-CoA dehydrogenase family protein n=1 Tax=Purpureocillium lavendulum TaxID=1247861 RepID=A0AB34FE02_9HYPO|nr:acyl-CoA dehydrogenase family protein [Purpureocillium lavendulum]